MIFKNRDFFPLNRREKVLREILRSLLIIIISTIIMGIINQNHKINQDYILVPIFATASEFFCIIYAYNAFTTGNLVRRWANDSVLISIYNFIQSKIHTTDKKTLKLTTYIFGIFTLIILSVAILFELNFYFWSKTV